MKKFNLLLLTIFLLFLVLGVNTKAIIPDLPVLTHEGSEVPYVQTSEFDDERKKDIFQELYGKIVVENSVNVNVEYDNESTYTIKYPYGLAYSVSGTLSNLYNCHAFALHFKGVEPNGNVSVWISNPSIYFTDGSLIEIEVNEVCDGDVVAYYAEENNEIKIIHTGIITDSTIKTIEELMIRSKDGYGLLLDHKLQNCDYYRGDNNLIKFYRWNHIYNDAHPIDSSEHYYPCEKCNEIACEEHSKSYTKLEDAFSHLASCSVCLYSGNEPHRYVQLGTKYRCLDCKFISSFQSITPIGRSANEIKFICSYDVSQTMMTYKEMINYLTENEYYELLVEFNMFYNAIVK